MNEWKIHGARVYGNGQSYNCTNKITAEQLHTTLTKYQTQINTQNNEIQTNNNPNKIKQQLIALQMDIHNVQADLDKIKELLK